MVIVIFEIRIMFFMCMKGNHGCEITMKTLDKIVCVFK